MRKLAIALALLLAPLSANAASYFWVGGDGTWDGATTTHWATSSGGAGSAGVPVGTDTCTFDGNGGAGTGLGGGPNITMAAGATCGTVTLGTTGGNFIGTLDDSVNNISPTFQSFNWAGSGTRGLKLGTGTTWTLTSNISIIWNTATTTGLTLTPGTSTIVIGTCSSLFGRSFSGGGLTFYNLTLSCPSTNGNQQQIIGGNTFNNITLTNVLNVSFTTGSTTTISGTLSNSGSSASALAYIGTTQPTTTLSVAGANTLNWALIQNLTKAGAGSITANNSYDGAGNSGITINNPAGGSHGIIGN